MGDEYLDRLEVLASNATAGPWLVVGKGLANYSVDADNGDGTVRVLFERQMTLVDQPSDTANGDFICAAREAVPKLVEEVRLLRGVLADVLRRGEVVGRYSEALRRIMSVIPTSEFDYGRTDVCQVVAREALEKS